MNGVGGDGDFVDAGSFGSGIDQDFGSWFDAKFWERTESVVVLDIVSGDLKIADFRAFNANATEAVVADVGGGDVDLVEVDLLHEDSGTAIVVDVAIGDEDVAVSFDQMNAVTGVPDHDTVDDGLHGVGEFDAIGFGMVSFNGDLADLRHAFVIPDFGLLGFGMAGSFVVSDEADRWSGAGHDEVGGSQ